MATPVVPGPNTLPKPRVFYLNERQELFPIKPTGGGRFAAPKDVDWQAKSVQLSASFRTVVTAADGSVDPASQAGHLFLLARPEEKVEKYTKKKTGDMGTRDETPAFGGSHAMAFRKINLDLLGVRRDGSALLHLLKRDAHKFESRIAALGSEQTRPKAEEARWARFKDFESLTVFDKVSRDWVESMESTVPVDVILHFFPVLSRRLFRQVAASLSLFSARLNSSLLEVGQDVTGAFWCVARFTQKAVVEVAASFPSVRWIHPPHDVCVFGDEQVGAIDLALAQPTTPANLSTLPKLAIVDVGLPRTHPVLDPYRLGQYSPPRFTAQSFPHHAS